MKNMAKKTIHSAQTCPAPASFTQKKAKEMFLLLAQIHEGLRAKNSLNLKKTPGIELYWMIAIEDYFPKEKQFIKNRIKKSKPFASLRKKINAAN